MPTLRETARARKREDRAVTDPCLIYGGNHYDREKAHSLLCLVCGARYQLPSPMDMSAFARTIKEFDRTHRETCAPQTPAARLELARRRWWEEDRRDYGTEANHLALVAERPIDDNFTLAPGDLSDVMACVRRMHRVKCYTSLLYALRMRKAIERAQEADPARYLLGQQITAMLAVEVEAIVALLLWFCGWTPPTFDRFERRHRET